MARDWDKERKAAKNMTIGSCIFGIFFMVVWTAIAPSFMKLFGLGGLAMMIYRLYVLLQLSKEKKQEPRQEIEPWERPAIEEVPRQEPKNSKDGFCPYCGRSIEETFEYCPKCGRKLP